MLRRGRRGPAPWWSARFSRWPAQAPLSLMLRGHRTRGGYELVALPWIMKCFVLFLFSEPLLQSCIYDETYNTRRGTVTSQQTSAPVTDEKSGVALMVLCPCEQVIYYPSRTISQGRKLLGLLPRKRGIFHLLIRPCVPSLLPPPPTSSVCRQPAISTASPANTSPALHTRPASCHCPRSAPPAPPPVLQSLQLR